MVKDEVQWYVVGDDDIGYIVTYGTVGSLSKGGNSKGVSTSTALRRIREAYFDNEIIGTGHTHWDSNQEFSGHDARFLAGSGNNIKTVLDKKEIDGKFNKHKFMIYVSTSNGSYRTMKYSYAKNTLND